MDEAAMRQRGFRFAMIFAAVGLTAALLLLMLGLGANFRWSAYALHLLGVALGLFGVAAALGGWAGAWTFRGKGLLACLVVAVTSLVAGVTAGCLTTFLVMPAHEAFGDALNDYLFRPLGAVLVPGVVPALVLGTVYFIVLKAGARGAAEG
jgi:hypothetical protein